MKGTVLLTSGTWLAAGALLAAATLTSHSPQQDRPQFSVASELVVLNVAVTDQHGEYLRDLPVESFHVMDEGQPQHVKKQAADNAGRQFQPIATKTLRDLVQGRETVRAVGGREAALLVVAATYALSFTFFPEWLGLLVDRELALRNCSDEEIEELIKASEPVLMILNRIQRRKEQTNRRLFFGAKRRNAGCQRQERRQRQDAQKCYRPCGPGFSQETLSEMVLSTASAPAERRSAMEPIR